MGGQLSERGGTEIGNRELLAIAFDTCWVSDARGRLIESREAQPQRAPLVIVGRCDDGYIIRTRTDVPSAIAAELRDAFVGDEGAPDAPDSLERCERLLRGLFGVITVRSGPYYVIPRGTSFACDARIVRSDGDDARSLAGMARVATWRADEWDALLDGVLGPWAMAVVDGAIASLCHCARLGDAGADAGVETVAAYRGRGLAAAVTAAWAAILEDTGRRLFYSTSADNVSSQRVAERLGLPLIGWQWQFYPA